MRVLGNLPVVKEANANMPFGATIQNETPTQQGTPVVREIIGDPLTNLYRLLELAKITPTGTEDSDATQYQIVEALKKLPNSLNDIERILMLGDVTWTTDLDLSILPNKYFFIARASENYVGGINYKFKGTDDLEYDLISSGFNASDELLVIIDQSMVRVYSLTNSSQASSDLLTPLGTPLSYNDSNKLWYQESGKLISESPSINDLQSIIATEISDFTLIVLDIFVVEGKVLCFCYLESSRDYFFRQFDLNDLSSSVDVTITGIAFESSDDFMPYIYLEKGFVYVTNQMNIDEEDNILSKLAYAPSTASMLYVSDINLNNTFSKTTNAVIRLGKLYTMISGTLVSWDLTSGTKNILGDYTAVLGQLFAYNGKMYFGSGEAAKTLF